MTAPTFHRSIPNLVTCLGLAVSTFAIILIIEGNIVLGGSLVLISALMDGLDGELARRLKVSSEMGVQLDSLADVVCFGVAPAALMTQYLDGSSAPSWLTWSGAMIFVLCAALRLARFNATIADDLLRDFQGLPTTGAGSFLALLIYLDYQSGGSFFPLWSVPLVAVFLALLMVSNIRFMSKKGHKALAVVSLTATALLGIFVSLPLAGLIFLGSYILHGLFRAAWTWLKAARARRALRAGRAL